MSVSPAGDRVTSPRQPISPGNLHQRSSTDERRSLSERMEQKYFVRSRRTPAWLWRSFDAPAAGRPVPRRADQQPVLRHGDLDQHERSLSGEFAKDKVRIRWYGGEHALTIPRL